MSPTSITSVLPPEITPTETPALLVARQMIVLENLQVHGYELLYRSEPGSTGSVSGFEATSHVIATSVLSIGLQRLVGRKLAFLNVDREFLMSPHVLLLPPKTVVLELLETIQPDEDILARCRELKSAGWPAVDDYRRIPERTRFSRWPIS